jgi:hypothetical protein
LVYSESEFRYDYPFLDITPPPFGLPATPFPDSDEHERLELIRVNSIEEDYALIREELFSPAYYAKWLYSPQAARGSCSEVLIDAENTELKPEIGSF